MNFSLESLVSEVLVLVVPPLVPASVDLASMLMTEVLAMDPPALETLKTELQQVGLTLWELAHVRAQMAKYKAEMEAQKASEQEAIAK